MRTQRSGVIPLYVHHGHVQVGMTVSRCFPSAPLTSDNQGEVTALSSVAIPNEKIALIPYLKLIEPNSTSTTTDKRFNEYYFAILFEKHDSLVWVNTLDTLTQHPKSFLKQVAAIVECLQEEYLISHQHLPNGGTELCERARSMMVSIKRPDMLFGVTVKAFRFFRDAVDVIAAADFYHKHRIDWLMNTAHPRTKDVDTVTKLASIEMGIESMARTASHVDMLWFQNMMAMYTAMGIETFGPVFERHALRFTNAIWQYLVLRLTNPTPVADFAVSEEYNPCPPQTPTTSSTLEPNLLPTEPKAWPTLSTNKPIVS